MLHEPTAGVPVGEHPIPERHAYAHDNRWLLRIIGALMVALVIVGVVAFVHPSDNAAARAKAVKLESLLRREGLPLPASLSVFAQSLGTDGGLVCKSSGYNLTDAILNQQNSAGSGGLTAGRPLPVASEILNGQLAIIDVYCPSRAKAFENHFAKYKLYNLVRP
jgi:hypothetical protein